MGFFQFNPIKMNRINIFDNFITTGLLIILIGIININAELTPPYFNLATGRKIYASATCGVGTDGPELYCKLVGANTENEFQHGSVIHGQICDYCDLSNPDLSHPPENAIDGKETWWQSPPLSRGMKYNEVNLTIDFGQEFHVAYVFIRMGNSPRPGVWTLEKSSDYGKTWHSWMYFSDTHTDCDSYFGNNTYKSIENDNDVICTTDYSKIVPLENGEIPVNLLKDRPSANNYFNSTALQEWTRATNVRIRLLRTKNLLGHLMSVARQDPTVTRRYFYSIKDISIGGRCMCNGHADTCDVLDPRSPVRILACRCQHDTCGIQCNECCPGFEQKKWSQNTNARPFRCEPCNCHGHSTECIYDEETDLQRLSLDIHGNYEGGGVCQNCQDNTKGINCNECIPKYYRPYGKHWNETDVCKPCNCDHFSSTGNCEEETGRCECKPAYQPPNCDSCAYGYFGYPNCRECECNLNGTREYYCEATEGYCPCKENFAGKYCKECAEGYYSYPECKVCECSDIGALSNNCDFENGQCQCKPNFGGHNCESCKDGYYSFPNCLYCDCDVSGTEFEICDKDNGKCLCREGFGGPRCDQCLPGYYNYPNCVPCECSTVGSRSKICDATGKCTCLANFAGKQCTVCQVGYYNYPECLACNCNTHGAEGISCNDDGQCSCLSNFDGKICDVCKEGYYNFPACEECNCDPAGVIQKFAGCGSVPAGELCKCKERVSGRICNKCKPLYWNLNISNPDGCEECECFLDGTVGALDTCDSKSGQCTCKPSVTSRDCSECKDGSFDLNGGSLFGCKDCDCDIGGSRNLNCDKQSGNCNCHPRITGRTCTQPLTTHYFPTLYQFQFEYEDGYTPSGAHVRYQYDNEQFPDFSGKGYAVFSGIQNKALNEINVFKSSVYRMVIRYVNPTDEDVVASILIQSDNPSEVDQNAKVLLKPTMEPKFVTVSGSKGDKPSPIVLDPGRYTITTESVKNIMLDYFVLLPAAYYEASILTRNIQNPCEIGNMDLCRHYKYVSVDEFKPVTDPIEAEEIFTDSEHMIIIDHKGVVPALTEVQNSLKYNLDVPHTGRYVIVIDYVTSKEIPQTNYIKVRVGEDNQDYGTATLYTCLYTMGCRQPVLDEESREKLFFIDVLDSKPVELYHGHEDFGKVGVLQITAIPVEDWSVDFIEPNNVCVIHDKDCAPSKYPAIPDAKKIEFEADHEERITPYKPPYAVKDENIKLIYLDRNNASIMIGSKVTEPGRYIILLKYYQPNHPRYNVPFRLNTEKILYDGKFEVNHCPSSSGCRGIIRPESTVVTGDNTWFDIDDEFTLTLTNNKNKGVWLDYIIVVPIGRYTDDLLVEEPFDQTKEFISKCGQDHYYIPLNASEFCRKAVFSLTADYNHGALPCNCNYDGSTSFECDPYGGQCQCRPNIIGRHCDACRTGFYGFPDCKPCDCPITALCEKSTGECICPTHVTGEKCDQCKPYTYGFHQIIGCEECNCHPLGVLHGNMQCDLFNGSCQCRPNIEGRACDQCSNGYYGFPNCHRCNCNHDGTELEICDKDHGECYCKKNVVGEKCDHCVDGTYNLQRDNAVGCTQCFCFGKSQRCKSAYLEEFKISLIDKVAINNVYFDGKKIEFSPWLMDKEQILKNDTLLEADFTFKDPPDGFVYFSVLAHLFNLNSHITAYGGELTYNLYYTTGPFGKSLVAPDLILKGRNITLKHQSDEQPSSSNRFNGSVKIVESNFATENDEPVSRADLMLALRDLEGIYIRANYWEETVLSRLSDVALTMGFVRTQQTDEHVPHGILKLMPVEECYCPLGYTGLSCEDCAPGFYRVKEGLYGGYCAPCQCNGHADSCDCNTGICKDCQHSTTGDHCEFCIEGYHGNATYGTPHDCMICPCPLPIDSNNFATSCEFNPSGFGVNCQCKPGYTGPKCESCAPGYYGVPENVGDYCKPCQCSGNINLDEPGSCDTVTGECKNCLNNTFGPACNLCAPGFYGDAIKLKDCKSCDCVVEGTSQCDPFVGTCNCHENVIGERCDRCEPDHYGFESGFGCKPCDCGIASNSTQCDDHTGACPCKPGVSGRQCDHCARDYWNYNEDGCTACLCNKGFSRGFGCNTMTGQCECLPGVIGKNCDSCPYRWVLIKDEGCFECDKCHHALLDVTDALRDQIDPVVGDFKSVQLAYFTDQKLKYYNDLTEELVPKVQKLDPKKVVLTPFIEEMDVLEIEAKQYSKSLKKLDQNAKDSSINNEKLIAEVKNSLEESKSVVTIAHDVIEEVKSLSDSFDTSIGAVKADRAIDKAKEILNHLNETKFDLKPANDQLDKANSLHKSIEEEIMAPVKDQADAVAQLKKGTGEFKEKLADLHKWSNDAIEKANQAAEMNRQNKITFDDSKFDTVENQDKEISKNMKETKNLLTNCDLTLETIGKNIQGLQETLLRLKNVNVKVDDLLPEAESKTIQLKDRVEEANMRAVELETQANNLRDEYADSTSDKEPAIKAATAYSDIVNAVAAAQNAVKDAKHAAGNVTEKGSDIKERAEKSDNLARELLGKARNSLSTVQTDLQPHLDNSSQNVDDITKKHEDSEKELSRLYTELQSLPKGSQTESIEMVIASAERSNDNADDALAILKPLKDEIPKSLAIARNMSDHVDRTNQEIEHTTKQVDKVMDAIPLIKTKIDHLDEEQKKIDEMGKDLMEQLENLKRQIETTRQIANEIKIGVAFGPATNLELKPPEALPLLAQSSRVSAYFKTDKPKGFLMYLGNDNKTGPYYQKNPDYMALEIENGVPVLYIDLGDGPEKVISDKYVADNKWYQVIVDRNGENVKLSIREALPGGEEKTHDVTHKMPGQNNKFNVDKNSRLFVGGYPPDFVPPPQITQGSFEGAIEELKIGDEEVGLWNFIDGQDNNRGAARNVLLTKEQPSTGYRFNGNGYVMLDAKSYSFKHRSSIQFDFKTSTDTKEGLLFYAGHKRHFISVEMRNGGILFQYKLGEHLFSIHDEQMYNDDRWHTVEAQREGQKGLLKIDGKPVFVKEAQQGVPEDLIISDVMYFGGVDRPTNHSEVTTHNFDGCIDKVLIEGYNSDLSRHLVVFGARTGCPHKFSSSLSYRPKHHGYLKQGNVSSNNDFEINMRFRTKQKDGIIFYATNHDQSSTIGLTIDDGNLILRSMKEEVQTEAKRYDDGEWHIVTAKHDDDHLRLKVDEVEDVSSRVSPTELWIEHGQIFFGGLPNNYKPIRDRLSNLAYFIGCINDVTLNGQIVNFADSNDKVGGSFEDCPSDLLYYDVLALPIYYVGTDSGTGFIDIAANEVLHYHTPKPHHEIRTTKKPNLAEQWPPMPDWFDKQTESTSTERDTTTSTSTTTTTTTTSTTTTEAPTIATRPTRRRTTSRRPTVPEVLIPPTIPSVLEAPTKLPAPETSKSDCVLPINPDYDVGFEAGYRFISVRDRRVEINSIASGKFKKQHEISLEFRTLEKDGLLFYASDSRHTDFIALYLNNGQVYHKFRAGRVMQILNSTAVYNDNIWHVVEFSRLLNRATLIIDSNDRYDEAVEAGRAMSLQYPFYVGGVDPNHKEGTNANTLLEEGTLFTGCIRNILFNKQPTDKPPHLHNVVPCSEHNERGTFFGAEGGFVKLQEHFRVSTELTIQFDFKPRTQNGILFSVHGKSSHLILELYNGSIIFNVQNDETHKIEAKFEPLPGVNFCDGKWRTVSAVKSQYVITLAVDGISSNPGIGDANKASTDTTRALFMGGHPFIKKPKGWKSSQNYHGCIRNVKIREIPTTYKREQIKGDVWPNMCPTN
ncbi:laminin subunit alpha [Condylostylus longicornis]|uniref:laminin subunit alpha n=1 Tax=Condylostylus longicornis TaxID=2530218 RepID=UPI00244DD7E1|nr:laminin subunit alpha [Condylostylus longicornis]